MSNYTDDVNSLVQDVIDGYENPARATKVLTKRRDNAIDQVQMLTRCLEEIEGADIDESQREVLKKRFETYLLPALQDFIEMAEIIQTTKVTDLSCMLDDELQKVLGAIAEIKRLLG